MIIIEEVSEKFEGVIVTRVESQYYQSLRVSHYKKRSTFFLIMYSVHAVKDRGVLLSRRRACVKHNQSS